MVYVLSVSETGEDDDLETVATDEAKVVLEGEAQRIRNAWPSGSRRGLVLIESEVGPVVQWTRTERGAWART